MRDPEFLRRKTCAERLHVVAVGSAATEAKLLINHAGDDDALLESLIQRRLLGEPVDRIIGKRGFWTLDLYVTPDVLSPRPDTETIVELARDLARDRARQSAHNGQDLRILDLGTGSGAILLALLAEFPQAIGIGLDISQAALDVAKRNAELNGLAVRARFIQASWDQKSWEEAFPDRFDVIVSNPPYIPTADLASLETEVIAHDPRIALDGGEDGLDPYRLIFAALPKLLKPNGIAVFEIGYGQDISIPALAEQAGLKVIKLKPDLSAIPRALALSLSV
jgi:release factor glutamine methyltransferase